LGWARDPFEARRRRSRALGADWWLSKFAMILGSECISVLIGKGEENGGGAVIDPDLHDHDCVQVFVRTAACRDGLRAIAAGTRSAPRSRRGSLHLFGNPSDGQRGVDA